MLNIDDLTVAQIKQIAALANSLGGCATKTNLSHPFTGRYVICRCYSAGVHAGELVSQDGDLVILKKWIQNCRAPPKRDKTTRHHATY